MKQHLSAILAIGVATFLVASCSDRSSTNLDGSRQSVAQNTTQRTDALEAAPAATQGSVALTESPNIAVPFASVPAVPALPAAPLIISHARFVKMLKNSGIVKLPLGSVVILEGLIELNSGTTLTTNPRNPATIVMARNQTSALAINGPGITIENVKIDFNTGSEWRPFLAAISFKIPSYINPRPAKYISNVIIQNVEFIDSKPPVSRGKGDNWCINFSHNLSDDLSNVVVQNNKHTSRPWAQLTAGGTGNGLGINNILIANNLVAGGEMNSISVSSSGAIRTVRNITIRDNRVSDAKHLGIFVGQDGENPDLRTSLENICITGNRIALGKGYIYPSGIYLRATGTARDVWIENNVIDMTEPATFNLQPRRYTLAIDSGRVVMVNNEFLGAGSTAVFPGTTIITEPKSPVVCYEKNF